MLDKFEVARALREIGALLELGGENPFKVRAYENGARAVEGLSEDLGALVAGGRLLEVKGIGEALAKKIAELHRTGTTEVLARLREVYPPGTLELVRIPEVGPRKAAALIAALGIHDLDDLERACLDGKVRAVKGFGERTEARILEGVRPPRSRSSPTCAPPPARPGSSSPDRPGACARRSRTSTSSRPRMIPPRSPSTSRATRSSRRSSPAGTPRPPCGSPPGSRSTCGSFRPPTSPPCSTTSPARRRTT